MDRDSAGTTPGKSEGNSVDRRVFLTGLAAFSGTTALAAATPELLLPKSSSENSSATPLVKPTTGPSPSDRGKVLNVRSEIKEYKDPKTGAKIRQLTSDGSNNNHPYFTSEGFIGDDANRVIFISDRSGRYQWYMLEISSGKLVQLTSGAKCGPNAGCVSRNGHLYYFDGPVLKSVNVETLEERDLYRVPNGFRAGLPTCSADGHYVVFAYCQTLPVSTASGVIYSTMIEQYYQRPQSVVMRIDTAAATAVCVWGDTAWISHVLIHPTQPNLVLFVHEGGSTVVGQRMWMVDLNQKRARQAIPLYPQKIGESCVHEFFTKQGEVGVQYSLDRGDDREEYNMFLRTDGSWIRQHRYPGKRPGHVQSNSDNTMCVGDCGYLTPKDEDGNQYISLMTHNNGEVQARRLAWHRTSWHTQESHPHPVFSADDRWVLYNSDVEKRYNVYMADTQSI